MQLKHVGEQLREAREARGMSVEDVAQITKLTGSAVRAIEDGTASLLPAPVFVRGFVRAYAQTVGLDGHELTRMLDGADEGPSPAASRSTEDGPRPLMNLETGPTPGGAIHPSHLLLVVVALGMILAAWFLSGSRAAVQANAGLEPPPEIQERVDGVSAYTDPGSPSR
jgi:cytoskeleton protein RodZ